MLKLRKHLAADKAKCISGNGDSDDKVFCLVVAICKKHFALIRRSKYSGTYIQGTPSGPRQMSPEWSLGWGLIIINQKIKYCPESVTVIVSRSLIMLKKYD